MKKIFLTIVFLYTALMYSLTGCDNASEKPVQTKHIHEYVEDSIVPPTCTEKGYTKKICSTCKDIIQTDEVEALNHSYVDTVIAATCTEKGYTNRVCSVCNDTVQADIVEALNHSYVDTVIAATCTEKGYTNRVCSVCNDTVVLNEVEALNHSYADTVIEPTCTEKGCTKRVCSACNDTVILNEVEALDHSYTHAVVEATCEAQGYTEHRCDRCNNSYKDSYIDPIGHSYNIDNSLAAYKEQLGYILYRCANCNNERKETYTNVQSDSTNVAFEASKVYADIVALEASYPSGMKWTNDDYYGWSAGIFSGGYGCAGFAFMLSDAAFGDLPARKHTDFSNIKVGDIIRINNDTHSVVALSFNENGIIVAEGNYGRCVHWYREISYDHINKTGAYVITRYPE